MGMPVLDPQSRPFATASSLPGTQDLLIGAGIGSVVGKLLVHQFEQRRGEEMPPQRVRQIEAAWIAFGVTISFIRRVVFG